MPAQTSNGLPYPLGADPISQGDDAIKALADELNKRVPYRLAGGSGVAVGGVLAGNNLNINIVYPVGLFTQPPVILAITGSNRLGLAVLANTKDGATLQVANFTTATAAATTLSWLAMQLVGP